jgi:hypothetical protein
MWKDEHVAFIDKTRKADKVQTYTLKYDSHISSEAYTKGDNIKSAKYR